MHQNSHSSSSFLYGRNNLSWEPTKYIRKVNWQTSIFDEFVKRVLTLPMLSWLLQKLIYSVFNWNPQPCSFCGEKSRFFLLLGRTSVMKHEKTFYTIVYCSFNIDQIHFVLYMLKNCLLLFCWLWFSLSWKQFTPLFKVCSKALFQGVEYLGVHAWLCWLVFHAYFQNICKQRLEE